MNISNKEKNLLFLVISIAAVCSAHFGAYAYFDAKTVANNAEIETSTTRLEALNTYVLKVPEYEKSIEDNQKLIESILDLYPQEVRTEEIIEYVLLAEDEIEMDITGVNFAELLLVHQDRIVTQDNGENKLSTIAAFRNSFTLESELTYEQFKDFVDFVYDTEEMTVVDNIAISFDSETGGLLSSSTLSKFFITDENYEYEPTDFPDVRIGQTDFFAGVVVNRPVAN